MSIFEVLYITILYYYQSVLFAMTFS